MMQNTEQQQWLRPERLQRLWVVLLNTYAVNLEEDQNPVFEPVEWRQPPV
jgi:hypothetical protein